MRLEGGARPRVFEGVPPDGRVSAHVHCSLGAWWEGLVACCRGGGCCSSLCVRVRVRGILFTYASLWFLILYPPSSYPPPQHPPKTRNNDNHHHNHHNIRRLPLYLLGPRLRLGRRPPRAQGRHPRDGCVGDGQTVVTFLLSFGRVFVSTHPSTHLTSPLSSTTPTPTKPQQATASRNVPVSLRRSTCLPPPGRPFTPRACRAGCGRSLSR